MEADTWADWRMSNVRRKNSWSMECVGFSADMVTWVAGDGCGPVTVSICEGPRYVDGVTAPQYFFGERIKAMAVCCAADAEHQLFLKRFYNPDRWYWIERIIEDSTGVIAEMAHE